MKEETAEQAAARKAADAKRKRDERARKKLEDAAKATETTLAQAETVEDFWAASLTTVNPAKLAEWKARQEEIFDTLHWMREVMDGTYNVSPDDIECYVSLEEGDEDIKRMLREYGETFATAVLLLPLWQEPHTLAQLTKGGENHPTTIFARYGILTALPDWTVFKWEQFMQTHRRKSQSQLFTSNGYVQMQCECYTPITSRESVPSSMAEAYARTGIKFLCGPCRSRENNSRQAAKSLTAEFRQPQSNLRDDWGRLKDQ